MSGTEAHWYWARIIMAAHWRQDHHMTWKEIERRTGWGMKKKDNDYYGARSQIEAVMRGWEAGK